MTTPDLGQKTRAETAPEKPVRTWTGLLGLLDTPTNDHRALTLPSLGTPAHQEYPLPLLARTADVDATTTCGTIRRIWRNGNTIRGWGRIEIEPDTTWGHNLLRGNPQPVGLWLCPGAESVLRNGAWWHPIARVFGADHPKIHTSHTWTVRGAFLHEKPAWLDAYITLEEESRP